MDIVETLQEFEEDITWFGIDGNHDFSWIKRGAPSPTKMISERVANFNYVPGNIIDRVVRGDVIIGGTMNRLVHPWSNSGRGAYALSYPAQTYLRNLMSGGVEFEVGDKKFHMASLQYGHLHYDMNFTSFGVNVTHPMSFQGHNDFTEGKGLTGPVGLRLEKIIVVDGEVTRRSSRPLIPPNNL